MRFIDQSRDSSLAGRRPADWTYEIDAGDQITLRYWLTEFTTLSEQLASPPSVTTPAERADLQNLLTRHVKSLKAKVAAL